MVPLESYRKEASALAEVSEVEHFGMLAFQRGKVRFAAFDPRKGALSLRLAATDPVRADGIARGVLAPAPGKYGNEGWTTVDLERMEWDEFVALLASAHALAAESGAARRRRRGNTPAWMLAVILAMAAGPAAPLHAADPAPAGARSEELRIPSDGAVRTAHLHLPPDLQGKRPLVVALHGGGSNGRTMESHSGLSELADRKGFLVAYPDGSGRLGSFLTWNAGWCCGHARDKGVDDVAFLDRLLDALIASGRVDPDRVYMTGMSNGAMMAYRYAAAHPGRLAALGAVAGTADFDPPAPAGPLPVVHLHGTKDENVPFEGGRGSRTIGTSQDHRPVQQTLDAWIHADGAGNPRSTALPAKVQDGTAVTRTAWSTGQDSLAVVLYRIEGGGHAWPGRKKSPFLPGRATANLDADSTLWDFFARHVRTVH